ncbi:MAG TPA: dTMP kinase [Gemmata sp.]
MERTDNGLLIAFEGIDGAGKTTQVEFLEHFLRAAGVPFTRSKEPTDGPWGRKIRASAGRKRMEPAEELHAFTEDRKEHVRDLIAPALARGEVVVLDRYFYSTIAYQGALGGDPARIAAQMFEFAPTPDAVILIDVPVEIGIARIEEGRKETPNKFENVTQLRASRAAFRSLPETYPNVVLIDGAQSAEAVRRAVMSTLIEGVLKKKFCAKRYGCSDPFTCGPRITGTCTWANMCKHAKL